MNSEQFRFYLKGFLSDKETLNKEQLNVIKEELNKVTETLQITHTPTTYPGIITYPYYKWSSTSALTGTTLD